MILVQVKESKEEIASITIKGHSGYSEAGSDIVCASVSSIVITTINALVRFKANIKYKEKDGFIEIQFLEHNEVTNILTANMLDLFKELEKQYKNNIKINKEVSSC